MFINKTQADCWYAYKVLFIFESNSFFFSSNLSVVLFLFFKIIRTPEFPLANTCSVSEQKILFYFILL